ncbi:MAG: hypothetical protein R2741_15530 [Methanolobus sp.]
MLRVGVIGAGAMGKNHIRIYSEMPDAELVGADIDKELVGKTLQGNIIQKPIPATRNCLHRGLMP